jgi:hypothetical protein
LRARFIGGGLLALEFVGAQLTASEPVQAPDWQVSVCVQALLSLQAVPLAAAGFEQVPVAGSQVPATWH